MRSSPFFAAAFLLLLCFLFALEFAVFAAGFPALVAPLFLQLIFGDFGLRDYPAGCFVGGNGWLTVCWVHGAAW